MAGPTLSPIYIEQDAKAGAIKPVQRAGWEWAAGFPQQQRALPGMLIIGVIERKGVPVDQEILTTSLQTHAECMPEGRSGQ